MAEILRATNRNDGTFAVLLAGARQQHWSADMLHTYLMGHGYSDEDAVAIVEQAHAARVIEILVPAGFAAQWRCATADA